MKDLLTAIKTSTRNFSKLAVYSLESLPLLKIHDLMGAFREDRYIPSKEEQRLLLDSFKKMNKVDVENIRRSLYSIKDYSGEDFVVHGIRYMRILIDAISASYRRKHQITKSFSPELESILDKYPDYYRRNFHFQTDGYLSKSSADLYTHQTEILFKGTINLMRRVLLGNLVDEFDRTKDLRVLEFGSGGGETTDLLLQLFPKASITCVDLSEAYLKKAKETLPEEHRLNFVNEAAEKYESEEKYDIIISGYLFHELPKAVRETIFSRAKDQLNIDGVFVVLDSLQLGDSSEFDWALKEFPKDFHEPFYKNYIENHLSELSRDLGFRFYQSEAFLSKILICKRSS